MTSERKIHPDFLEFLKYKDTVLVDLYVDCRSFVLELYPQANELLYHTHALTSVYSISDKLSDAFIMLPIYTKHMNLGFNKGAILDDPLKLLKGTGKLIRHIPIEKTKDFRNIKVKSLAKKAIKLALEDMEKSTKSIGKTISKIKKL